MDDDIRIQPVSFAELDPLVRMYDQFEPLGAALSLPPYDADVRRGWIEFALAHRLNLGAFSRDGRSIGHSFLVTDEAHSAELAIFVHQDFRRRGIGTSLLQAMLSWGERAGLRRIWTLTASDNRAALRLQMKCGFRVKDPASPEIVMEIDLPRARPAPALQLERATLVAGLRR